ncbi:MAG: hypothetical protein ACFFDY_01075 [Candidatus Thorarchaeota archaeon]
MKELHADSVQIRCRIHNHMGNYRRTATKTINKQKISSYQLRIPSLWLPLGLTITEDELSVYVNHTKPGISR